jgi:uncharacterized repeat protein (TIGR03803 family)
MLNGVYYGTTWQGGAGDGVIYQVAPAGGNGWTEQVLMLFQGSDGAYPESGVLATTTSRGETVLLGTTYGGGAASTGAVYSLTESGGSWNSQVLYSFPSTGQGEPIGGIAMSQNGLLYGTALVGGTHDDGTLFQLKPNGKGAWTETVLHQFGAAGGSSPEYSLTFGPGGILYGTTTDGGGKDEGVVFSLQP